MRSPTNTITIHERTYVLAWVGASAVHLVPEAGKDEPGRPIAEQEGAVNPAYDETELKDPRWRLSTICGRGGWFMAPTEAGRANEVPWAWDDPTVHAPSCRTCLRILDHQFAALEPAEHLQANVARGITELEQWGSFMIDGVPADQMELLRTRVRAECRRRGWKILTMATDRRLVAVSENARLPEREAFVERDTLDRISGRVTDQPSWHFAW